jgi:hypothetical protein
MAELSGSEKREESLQTHGLDRLVAIVIESFLSLNISAFLLSIYVVLVRWFIWLDVWGLAVIVLVIGGYCVALLWRRDRIGWLYLFCCAFGCAIALRHSL